MDPEVATSRSRIAILGAGSVGSAIALCLILNPVASEVLLVDPNTAQRDAQVKDLEDATTYHGAVGYDHHSVSFTRRLTTLQWRRRSNPCRNSQGSWPVRHCGHQCRCETETWSVSHFF